MRFLKFTLSIILGISLWSCKDKTTSENTISPTKTLPSNNTSKTKMFSDVFEFVNYNDDGDYRLINLRKNNESFSFINDKNDDRSLMRGDKVAIAWKMDTIHIAGDGETPELAEWLVSFKKIKDGKLARFRKTYKLDFKYHWYNENEYSDGYFKHLYELVEYYVANSKNELLKLHIADNSPLEYSIEQQDRDGKTYTVLGLGTSFEGHMTKIQWLYYDAEKDDLYEYDLPNDKLILFP